MAKYKKIKIDGVDVQVESAVKDANGNKINISEINTAIEGKASKEYVDSKASPLYTMKQTDVFTEDLLSSTKTVQRMIFIEDVGYFTLYNEYLISNDVISNGYDSFGWSFKKVYKVQSGNTFADIIGTMRESSSAIALEPDMEINNDLFVKITGASKIYYFQSINDMLSVIFPCEVDAIGRDYSLTVHVDTRGSILWTTSFNGDFVAYMGARNLTKVPTLVTWNAAADSSYFSIPDDWVIYPSYVQIGSTTGILKKEDLRLIEKAGYVFIDNLDENTDLPICAKVLTSDGAYSDNTAYNISYVKIQYIQDNKVTTITLNVEKSLKDSTKVVTELVKSDDNTSIVTVGYLDTWSCADERDESDEFATDEYPYKAYGASIAPSGTISSYEYRNMSPNTDPDDLGGANNLISRSNITPTKIYTMGIVEGNEITGNKFSYKKSDRTITNDTDLIDLKYFKDNIPVVKKRYRHVIQVSSTQILTRAPNLVDKGEIIIENCSADLLDTSEKIKNEISPATYWPYMGAHGSGSGAAKTDTPYTILVIYNSKLFMATNLTFLLTGDDTISGLTDISTWNFIDTVKEL